MEDRREINMSKCLKERSQLPVFSLTFVSVANKFGIILVCKSHEYIYSDLFD